MSLAGQASRGQLRAPKLTRFLERGRLLRARRGLGRRRRLAAVERLGIPPRGKGRGHRLSTRLSMPRLDIGQGV